LFCFLKNQPNKHDPKLLMRDSSVFSRVLPEFEQFLQNSYEIKKGDINTADFLFPRESRAARYA
jgi:hypothetical protein